MKKTISILGSTGSIGTQTLDILTCFPELYTVIGLSGGHNIALLKKQIKTFKPKVVSVATKESASILDEWITSQNLSCQVLYGLEGLCHIASLEQDLIVISLVGTIGILPTYKAIKSKTTIALACKEVLVSAGDLIMNEAKANNVSIIPIDSEHAALKQCIDSVTHPKQNIDKIILTASGGPFWETPFEHFPTINKTQALKHPNWEMGAKISIDSATFVNKGLEIIEAHHLFNMPYDKINVLVHRQSIVHGIIECIDGNILAHLSPTDMHFPIQYALTYPKKYPTSFNRLDFKKLHTLSFESPNDKKFPLLNIAIEAGRKKGSYPVVFNAANEAAVSLFLQEKISFLDIVSYINDALNTFSHCQNLSIEEIVEIDTHIKHDILQPA